MAKRKLAPAPPTLTCERLAVLFYLFFGLASDPSYPATDAPIDDLPPAIVVLRRSTLPLFWESSEAPASHAAEWVDHWQSVRAEWLRFVDTNPTQTAVKTFDWAQAPALQAVHQADLTHHWGHLLDDLFHTELLSLEVSIRETWLHRAKRGMVGIPPLDTWHPVESQVVTAVFGEDLSATAGVINPLVHVFWNVWLGAEIDIERVRYNRSSDKRTKQHAAAVAALTFDPSSTNHPRPIKPILLSDVVRELQAFAHSLRWLEVTPLSERELTKSMDSYDALQLDSQFSGLSAASAQFEFLGRALGCITEMCGSTVQLELDSPLLDAPFLRGQTVARLWRAANRLPPIEGHTNAAAIGDAVTHIAREVANARVPNSRAEVFLDANDADSQWDSPTLAATPTFSSRAEVVAFLGLDPVHELPTALRVHVAADPSVYTAGVDAPILNVTAPMRLLDHQLQAIAFIVERLMNVTVKSPTTGPAAVPWGRLPGVLLADEVGVGKTLTMIGLIATIIHLAEQPRPPNWTSGTWGGVAEIPDRPSLIVCPTSLLAQWRQELQRFFKDGITVIDIGSVEKKWPKDLEAAQSCKTPARRQVWLTSASNIARMASADVAADDLTGRARILQGRDAKKSIFAQRFGCLFMDEAHVLRTGGRQWLAIDALASISLIHVLATATPFVEGPTDLLRLAQILRAPALAGENACQLEDKVHRAVRQRGGLRHGLNSAALDYMASSTTEPTRNPNDPFDPVASLRRNLATLTVQLRHILAPHTLRRTKESPDFSGNQIGSALPTFTAVHLSIEVSQGEKEAAALFEQSLDPEHLGAGELQMPGVALWGAFYSTSRAYLSLPVGQDIQPLTRESLNTACSKLCIMAELITKMMRHGPEAVIPAEFHGTRKHILDIDDLGLPPVHLPGYRPPLLARGEIRHQIQIVVFTVLAQFHDRIVEFLQSCGISALCVNGHQPPEERVQRMEQFKNDRSITVLLMSGVGAVGHNLFNARVLIIYEILWSDVMTDQLYGRIYRHGQTAPTYSIQLVAHDTVEVLMAVTALGKSHLASHFMQPTTLQKYTGQLPPRPESGMPHHLSPSPPPTNHPNAQPESSPPRKRRRTGQKRNKGVLVVPEPRCDDVGDTPDVMDDAMDVQTQTADGLSKSHCHVDSLRSPAAALPSPRILCADSDQCSLHQDDESATHMDERKDVHSDFPDPRASSGSSTVIPDDCDWTAADEDEADEQLEEELWKCMREIEMDQDWNPDALRAVSPSDVGSPVMMDEADDPEQMDQGPSDPPFSISGRRRIGSMENTPVAASFPDRMSDDLQSPAPHPSMPDSVWPPQSTEVEDDSDAPPHHGQPSTSRRPLAPPHSVVDEDEADAPPPPPGRQQASRRRALTKPRAPPSSESEGESAPVWKNPQTIFAGRRHGRGRR